MSSIATHIIQLVKSLTSQEQADIRAALASPVEKRRKFRRQLQRLPDGSYFNPDGIPNDDPIFQTLAKVEEERHRMAGPPSPAFD